MRLKTSLVAAFLCLLAASAIASEKHVANLDGPERDDVASYYADGGELLKALEYRDDYGNFRILAFGGSKQGQKREDDDYVSLHAYGFIEDHGGYLARWEIKDSNRSPLCGIRVLTPLVDVIDAGDGQALVVVPYWIACDGLDPTVVKLIAVYKDKKYAIRGSLPNQAGDQVTRTPADNIKELPGVVQKSVLAYWAKVEAATKKDARWSDPNTNR